MKKILGFIFGRWLMALLGLIAVALLIWFIGPLLAVAEYRPLESATVRLVLIGVIVAVYIGKWVWRLIRARQINSQFVDGLVKRAPAPRANDPATAELSILRKRFEDAAAVLKQSKLGALGKSGAKSFGLRRPYIYEFPWYIFIGAPGSGKTTALVHSGLQFPLAERFGPEEIKGVGGTRNCDWWFTDEAILLDTAGRYTTQESNEEIDSAAWGGFLQLLKKYRPRRPINGVLVTISVPDLLEQNAAQREAHAGALRKRIQELHEQLKIRFPLYVLVTKGDLMAGFMEFFNEYGAEERKQVWGFSFPVSAESAAPLANFGAEFSALEQRLNERLIERMQQERDPRKRALIYSFPQQFAGIKQVLGDFLERVFSPSRFEEKPLLRGVYFTSGTQEGNPIERVMGSLGRSLRLERKLVAPNKPSGKSFFLTRLLKEVIFPEAALAGANLRWERRRIALHWGAFLIIGLASLGLVSAWAISYERNQSYVADVKAKIEEASKQVDKLSLSGNADLVSLLPTLQSVRELPRVSSTTDDAPALMGFGLYQGDKLSAASQDAYQLLLHDAFLRRLDYRIEQQLRVGARQNPELLYEGLKAYIMLHEAEHFDASALKAFITVDWETNLPREVTLEQRKDLESHLDTLLNRGTVSATTPADTQLVARVRDDLARTPIAQRIYNRLRRQGIGADLPEFTIAKAAGPSAPLVFVRASGEPLTKGVPGLFSYDGYHKTFVSESERVTQQLAGEEGWVLGIKERGKLWDLEGRAQLLTQVRRLYLEDYARTWEALVNDIKVKRAGTLQESIQLTRMLSGADSPLPVLLRAIVKEVTLVQTDAPEKTLTDKAADKVKDTRDSLLKIIGQNEARAASPAGLSRPEMIVDERFAGLRQLVHSPAPGQPAPIEGTVGLINELHTHLTATEAAVKGGVAPPTSDVPNKIKVGAGRTPEPIRSMLSTLSASGSSQALGATRANLNQALNAAIGDFCNKAVAGRYPFVKGSSREVTQEDFARLFAPGGLMDEFFQKNLAQYVDTATRPWSFRQMGDARMGSPSETLTQFHRAQTIRDVFSAVAPKARQCGSNSNRSKWTRASINSFSISTVN